MNGGKHIQDIRNPLDKPEVRAQVPGMSSIVTANTLSRVDDIQDRYALLFGRKRHILQVYLAERGLLSRQAVRNHDQLIFRMIHLVFRVRVDVQDALIQIQGGPGKDQFPEPVMFLPFCAQ